MFRHSSRVEMTIFADGSDFEPNGPSSQSEPNVGGTDFHLAGFTVMLQEEGI